MKTVRDATYIHKFINRIVTLYVANIWFPEIFITFLRKLDINAII